MIVPIPTDEQIRSAHVIALFDPHLPEYHMVVVDTMNRTRSTPKELAVVDIPVDSTNAVLVAQWLDQIGKVRQALKLPSAGDRNPAPDVPARLIDALRRTLSNLKMLPEDAQQALLIASSPDCDIASLAGIIQRDLRLTAFILRIANSTLFGAPRPIASLHRAIIRIGIGRVRDLIIASSLEAISSKVSPALQSARQALWKHGFLTSILAVRLNELFALGFEGEEITAGLLHDFGRTLILIADPVNAPHIDPLDFIDPPNVEARERLHLGVSHAEFGAWFAEFNELPDELVAATRFHHRPADAGEWLQFASLISAADHAANWLQRVPGEAYDPASNTAVALLEESGTKDAKKRFAAEIPGLLEEAPALADALTSG